MGEERTNWKSMRIWGSKAIVENRMIHLNDLLLTRQDLVEFLAILERERQRHILYALHGFGEC